MIKYLVALATAVVATGLLAAGGVQAKSMVLTPAGEARNVARDSSGRTYVAWHDGRNARVTIKSRGGRTLAGIRGPRGSTAGPPRVAVVGDGVVLVWLGTSSVAAYTSRGRLIDKVSFKGFVLGLGGEDVALEGVEGRGGAVAVTDGRGLTPLSVIRVRPTGRFYGPITPFDDTFEVRTVRFAFAPGGSVAIARAGFDARDDDYINNGFVQVRWVSPAGALGPLSQLMSGGGGYIFGDAPTFTTSVASRSQLNVSWNAVRQPDSGGNTCWAATRRASSDGSVGDAVTLIHTKAGRRLTECPRTAVVAAGIKSSTALIQVGRNLKVVRTSGGKPRTTRSIQVDPSGNMTILHYDDTIGRAVVAWGVYSRRSKRTRFTVVSATASGKILLRRFSDRLDPAALRDVTISSSGAVAVLLQRKPNVSGGAKLLTFGR